jgi:flavorubredoxin
MKPRMIKKDIYWTGAIDWNRRVFDSLIPLPEGTSYNAYLIKGSEKTALLDTVDPPKVNTLLAQLHDIPKIDYLISHHAEQDHSGSIPVILNKYRDIQIITSPKGKDMLINHLHLDQDKIKTVDDGETLSLGNKTLQFIHTPWVHWPETMSTYLQEDKILFSCDFFGSHLATSDLFVTDESEVYDAAKRYYAEIMMPFHSIIEKNMAKLQRINIDMIAPSHGPIYDKPDFIIKAYKDWISDKPKNVVIIPYISMHQSTESMVQYLIGALSKREIKVYPFDLIVTDLGQMAKILVDAATIVIGTPTIYTGPHPNVVYATYLINALRPKLKYASIIGSYGWKNNLVENIKELMLNLKLEYLDTVLCKGQPNQDVFNSLEKLADTIKEKHMLLQANQP